MLALQVFCCFDRTEHDKEFEDLYSEENINTKQYRESLTLDDTVRRETFAKVHAFYESLGGDSSIDNEEIYNHRENRFGPRCPACGNNFRTPEASFCANVDTDLVPLRFAFSSSSD